MRDYRRATATSKHRVAKPTTVVHESWCEPVAPAPTENVFSRVGTDVDVLTGRTAPRAGSRVLVYDAEGHIRGVALACLLDARGSTVDYVTPFAAAAQHLEPPNKTAAMRQLRRCAVRTYCDTLLTSDIHGALLRDVWTEDESPVKADYGLPVAVGFRVAVDDALVPANISSDVTVIGDAKAPRLLRNAISEGARVAAAL